MRFLLYRSIVVQLEVVTTLLILEEEHNGTIIQIRQFVVNLGRKFVQVNRIFYSINVSNDLILISYYKSSFLKTNNIDFT